MTAPVAFAFPFLFGEEKVIYYALLESFQNLLGRAYFLSWMTISLISSIFPLIQMLAEELLFAPPSTYLGKILIHVRRQDWKKGYRFLCGFFRTSSPSAATLGFDKKSDFLSLADSYTCPNLFLKTAPACVRSEVYSCCRVVLHNASFDYD